MNSCESFSADYAEARAKFRDEALRAGGALEQLLHPRRGPDGGELHTDVGWFGPRDASRVLVMISATHGVEGFCGSGAQVDWLRRGEAGRLPPGVAVLMIHAINPYGFAWLRRVTHENVDLNRNWIDFTRPLPENPGYDEIAAAICPAEWTEESRRARAAVTEAYLARHGMAELQRAVTGGQYRHAQGVFYGGTAPTWSRRTQTAIFEHYLGRAARVAIIDYHTGLGPWGLAEQISVQPRATAEFARAASWYGAALTSNQDGSSSSATLVGDGLAAAPTLLSHAQLTAIAFEVGTKPMEEILNALLADTWLHAHGDPLSPAGQAIKRQMRAMYYGDAGDWKGMVAGQSLLMCKQAIAGLQQAA